MSNRLSLNMIFYFSHLVIAYIKCNVFNNKELKNELAIFIEIFIANYVFPIGSASFWLKVLIILFT